MKILWSIIRKTVLKIELIWEPRDLWIGIFWRNMGDCSKTVLHAYVCFIPCVPIHIRIKKLKKSTRF
jgi:hypothetical protein